MIISSNIPLEVGKTFTPNRIVLNPNEPDVEPQPIVILREATREEHAQQCADLGYPIGNAVAQHGFDYFYEISSD